MNLLIRDGSLLVTRVDERDRLKQRDCIQQTELLVEADVRLVPGTARITHPDRTLPGQYLVTADKPAQLIEKSKASPSVLAMLLITKYVDGLPLQSTWSTRRGYPATNLGVLGDPVRRAPAILAQLDAGSTAGKSRDPPR